MLWQFKFTFLSALLINIAFPNEGIASHVEALDVNNVYNDPPGVIDAVFKKHVDVMPLETEVKPAELDVALKEDYKILTKNGSTIDPLISQRFVENCQLKLKEFPERAKRFRRYWGLVENEQPISLFQLRALARAVQIIKSPIPRRCPQTICYTISQGHNIE